jgi:GNAT superfamily N-acetyltransferase
MSAPAAPPPVHVVPYDPARAGHRAAFRDLNLAWIERYFVVEPRDRHELDDPEGHILAIGGRIFMAESQGVVLGTCALLPMGGDAWELAKMAVREDARGRGVGRMLGESALAWAEASGAARVELLSNRRLAPAIALYRRLGFVEAPMHPTEYARADIRMVRALGHDTGNAISHGPAHR